MKYSVDTKNNKKAYMQLYEQIRSDITNSLYKYGDKLPSKRILAEETQTSVITVEHAYAIRATMSVSWMARWPALPVLWRKSSPRRIGSA